MTARRFGIALAVLLSVFVGSSPAGAQTATTCDDQPSYAPGSGQLTIDDSTVAPGETVQVSGGGFAAGSTINIDLNPGGIRLGTDTAGADCSFSATVTIPTSVLAGTYTIQASGTTPTGGALVLSAALTVGAEGVRGDLPDTGSNSSRPLTVAGIGLVLMGAAAVFTVRRRRSHPATD